jgi:hypothetical protein
MGPQGRIQNHRLTKIHRAQRRQRRMIVDYLEIPGPTPAAMPVFHEN